MSFEGLASNSLRDLGAEEALENIRSKFWGEGTLSSTTSTTRIGYNLLSGPYPDIIFKWVSNEPNITLGEFQTRLSVYAMPCTESTTNNLVVGVELRNACRVSDSSRFDLGEDIKIWRLPASLSHALSASKWKSDLSSSAKYYSGNGEGYLPYIDPRDEGAKMTLHLALALCTEFMKEQGLPGQIRTWREDILQSLPPQLRQDGHLGYDQLVEHSYKMRNIHLFGRVSDRGFRRFSRLLLRKRG